MICDGRGFVTMHGGARRCECRRRKIIQQKLEQIPRRFREASFENYVPMDLKQETARDRMSADFGVGYFLFGDYARGKTHLATAQYKKLVEAEHSSLFMTMGEVLMELRRAEMDVDYFCEVRQRVRHADHFHLFIDDIDKFKATDFKFEVLFDLFDTLYRRNLGLTVTSNHSLAELARSDNLNPAVVRRIDDTCQAIEV